VKNIRQPIVSISLGAIPMNQLSAFLPSDKVEGFSLIFNGKVDNGRRQYCVLVVKIKRRKVGDVRRMTLERELSYKGR